MRGEIMRISSAARTYINSIGFPLLTLLLIYGRMDVEAALQRAPAELAIPQILPLQTRRLSFRCFSEAGLAIGTCRTIFFAHHSLPLQLLLAVGQDDRTGTFITWQWDSPSDFLPGSRRMPRLEAPTKNSHTHTWRECISRSWATRHSEWPIRPHHLIS